MYIEFSHFIKALVDRMDFTVLLGGAGGTPSGNLWSACISEIEVADCPVDVEGVVATNFAFVLSRHILREIGRKEGGSVAPEDLAHKIVSFAEDNSKIHSRYFELAVGGGRSS